MNESEVLAWTFISLDPDVDLKHRSEGSVGETVEGKCLAPVF